MNTPPTREEVAKAAEVCEHLAMVLRTKELSRSWWWRLFNDYQSESMFVVARNLRILSRPA